jgi:hypothetical protein
MHVENISKPDAASPPAAGSLSFVPTVGSTARDFAEKIIECSRVLFHYYMIINDACILKAYKRSSSLGFRLLNTVKKLILPSKYNDYVVDSMEKFFVSPIEKLLLWRGPKMLCLNDSEGTTEEHLHKYAVLMNKKYKKKSRYEK